MNLREYYQSVESYTEELKLLQAHGMYLPDFCYRRTSPMMKKIIGRSQLSWLRTKKLPEKMVERLDSLATVYAGRDRLLQSNEYNLSPKEKQKRIRNKLLGHLSECKSKLITDLRSMHNQVIRLQQEVDSIKDYMIHMSFRSLGIVGANRIHLKFELNGFTYETEEGEEKYVGPGYLDLWWESIPNNGRHVYRYSGLKITRKYSEFRVNPHAGQGNGGSVCLGDADYRITTAIADNKIGEAIIELQSFYRSINEEDDWGRYIHEYPDYIIDANDSDIRYLQFSNILDPGELQDIGCSVLPTESWFIYLGALYLDSEWIRSAYRDAPIRAEDAVQLPMFVSKGQLANAMAVSRIEDSIPQGQCRTMFKELVKEYQPVKDDPPTIVWNEADTSTTGSYYNPRR